MPFPPEAPSADPVRSLLGNLDFLPLVSSIRFGDDVFVKLFGSKMA